MRIAFMAMAVVLVCVGVAIVLIAGEASSTQANADAQRKANDDLRQELQCRAVPTLAFDKEQAKLDALIAEGLAEVAAGAFDDPLKFAKDIQAQVAKVNATLQAREASLTECAVEVSDATTTSGD
jgi:cell division protein FtsL